MARGIRRWLPARQPVGLWVLLSILQVVDEAIAATEGSLAAYVSEYVKRQVQRARERIQQYGDG